MMLHFTSPVPGQPSIILDSIVTTATTISLSWSVPSDSVVTSFEVKWQRSNTSAGSSGVVTDGSSSYTIEALASGTFFGITVTVTNAAGSRDSPLVYVATSKSIEGNIALCEFARIHNRTITLGYAAKRILSSAGGSLSVVYCSVSDFSYVDVCETCQTSSTEDTYTAAIVGGVVAVVILSITTALTVIVVVALLKKHFGNYSTGAQRKYVMII